MHDVYLIPGLTGEEQFRKEAYARLQHGEGFTTFHHHEYETRVHDHLGELVGHGPMPIPCTTACRVNDPYPGHMYNKGVAGLAREPGPGTCAVYQHLDPLFFQDGNPPAQGHCINCHCTCYMPENETTLDDACAIHGADGCPKCHV